MIRPRRKNNTKLKSKQEIIQGVSVRSWFEWVCYACAVCVAPLHTFHVCYQWDLIMFFFSQCTISLTLPAHLRFRVEHATLSLLTIASNMQKGILRWGELFEYFNRYLKISNYVFLIFFFILNSFFPSHNFTKNRWFDMFWVVIIYFLPHYISVLVFIFFLSYFKIYFAESWLYWFWFFT